jgi:hypothetical protein
MTDTQVIDTKITRIEDRIDKEVASGALISMEMGGVQFRDMGQVMEFSKMMAVSGEAVPPHLRGQPGACLAVCTKALRFGFEPFSLAEHSMVMYKSTKNENGMWDRVGMISYDSFVFHAIIEGHARLDGPLLCEYTGEGMERRCTASGKSGGVLLEHTSPTLGERLTAIGKNEKGFVKGSPLWVTKPDQQLWYDTRRDWCRKFKPHVLMGMYDREELEEHGYEPGGSVKDVTPPSPNLMARLPGKMEGAGFQVDVVDEGLAKRVKEKVAAQATEPAQEEAAPEPDIQVDPAPQPAPAPAPATPAPQPKTAEQYVAYAAKWIELAADPDNIEARWDGEGEMRASLKLPLAARKRLQGMATTKAAELRKGRK